MQLISSIAKLPPRTKKILMWGAVAIGVTWVASKALDSVTFDDSPILKRSFAPVPLPPTPSEAERFRMKAPAHVQPYVNAILQVSQETGVAPELIYAIGETETNWGTNPLCKPKGAACTGDNGHGRGLMQIDDRSNAEWLRNNDWTDPVVNIRRGVEILRQKRAYLKSRVPETLLPRACIAAYNCGEGNAAKSFREGKDVDARTAHGNYSRRVLETMSRVA